MRLPDEKPTAIPTHYGGHTFRSRTEARWSAFFDLVGLRWEYEPEGVSLRSGWYLPDFWLPDMKCWAEVKPDRGLEPDERDKVLQLCEATRHNVLTLDGAPWPKPYTVATYQEMWDEGMEEAELRVWEAQFCFREKYLRPIAGQYHDGAPRIYWMPTEAEAEAEAGVAALMARARAIKLDEPNHGLPLGWEGIQPVT